MPPWYFLYHLHHRMREWWGKRGDMHLSGGGDFWQWHSAKMVPMLACVYPGLFLHTHTYTQFALSYPLLVISHPSPPAHPPPFSSPFSFPSRVREGYVNGQGGGLRKRRKECERRERCCGGQHWVIIFPVRLAARSVCVYVCMCVQLLS